MYTYILGEDVIMKILKMVLYLSTRAEGQVGMMYNVNCKLLRTYQSCT